METADGGDVTAGSQADPIEQEVTRRLAELRENDWALRRYDRNGDGKLDEHEWNVVVSLVRRQVQQEFGNLKSQSGQDPATPAAKVIVDFGDQEPDEWGVDTDPHIDLTAKETLGSRYDILHELGTGAQADTFLGRDRDTNQFVAIKELAIGRLDDWKSFELFEREAKVLRQLDHPSIPSFVDTLEVDTDGAKRMFLVQEYVDGETLEAEIQRRGSFESADVYNLAHQLLEVLHYLQTLSPPVIHRDIKPANVIRRRDGRLMLVDFGGVQTRISAEQVGGSTVVGTSGYMPPEQLMGRANQTTDLYGLGATLVHLATGHHPSMIPEERARLKWRPYATLAPGLADFVDRLLEPIWEDRPANAEEALDLLKQGAAGPLTTNTLAAVSRTALAPTKPGALTFKRPANSFVSVERSPRAIIIRVPPRFVRVEEFFVILGTFVGALALWAGVATGSPIAWITAGAGVLMAVGALAYAHRSMVITANRTGWSLRQTHGAIFPHETWHDATIVSARLPTPEDSFAGRYDLVVLDDEWRPLDTGLSIEETAWLVSEINAWVQGADG